MYLTNLPFSNTKAAANIKRHLNFDSENNY